MSISLLSQLSTCLVEGQTDEVVNLTREALKQGMQPLEVVNEGLLPGMKIVGEKFQSGEYFLPHVMIAADAMQKAMVLIDPLLQKSGGNSTIGTVVIGTVKGDIHEIGKNLVATMLSANGFKVIDLGVDVSVEQFITTARENNANLIGLSALLTTTMTSQREVINSLEKSNLHDRIKVMIGGAPANQQWADSIGADGYAEDAISAVELAKKLMKTVA
jgi:5-methyltetrahydrofolate--homocysteine methyltransferase